MSTPQWQNLPVPPNAGAGWSAFSVDPRNPQYQHLRAADSDRAAASSILASAYAEGRLDKDEYEQRLDQVGSAKSMGELVPVLDDLTVDRAQSQPHAQPQNESEACMPGMMTAQNTRNFFARLPRWWLGLAIMFNLIWLMTVLGTGHLIYYWPMWPMLGTAIPMIMGMIAGNNRRGSEQSQSRQLPPGQESDLR